MEKFKSTRRRGKNEWLAFSQLLFILGGSIREHSKKSGYWQTKKNEQANSSPRQEACAQLNRFLFACHVMSKFIFSRIHFLPKQTSSGSHSFVNDAFISHMSLFLRCWGVFFLAQHGSGMHCVWKVLSLWVGIHHGLIKYSAENLYIFGTPFDEALVPQGHYIELHLGDWFSWCCFPGLK